MASAQDATRFGDLRARRLTLPEAAQVLRVGVELIRKAVERGGLDPTYVLVGNRRIRALDGVDLVFLQLSRPYSRKVRDEIYRTLKHAPEDQPLHDALLIQVKGSAGRATPVEVPLRQSVAETLAGLAELERTERLIVPDEGGGGMIRGTGVEAHRIAALAAGGMSTGEILRDYPNLTAEQVKAAVDYAAAHPKQGRPYPRRTVKAVLREGRGGLERAFAAAREEG
jgi:uncharacterized protein (DUF433 family)